MGVVYKAFDPIIERIVAIKLLRVAMMLEEEEYQDYLQTFYREAKAAGRLNHPCIVMIHDVGEWRNLPYIVMEYLEGTNLHRFVVKKLKMSWEEAARIIRDVADALAYAHQHGVIHRDIKPSNIAILRDGRVKVLDFGVARLQGHETSRDNDIIGTPSYLAPEVLHGSTAQPESDIFSLGVVFYQLVTGAKPFQGESIAAVLNSILNDKPIPPTRLNPAVPPIFDTIILRMLAKSPQDRYRNAASLVQDLGQLIKHGHTIEIDIPDQSDIFIEELEPLLEDEPTLRENLPFWIRWLHQTWYRIPPRFQYGVAGLTALLVLWGGYHAVTALVRSPASPPAVPASSPATTPPAPRVLHPSAPPKTSRPDPNVERRRVIQEKFQLGKNYCLNRMYDRCARLMEEILKLDPKNDRARELLDLARRGGESPPSTR